MTLHLYDTMSRSVVPLDPVAPPRVTMYSCGATVWNRAHVGNFRTFLMVDLLRRWLEASGYQVFHIMNLTDVDDRIIQEAGKRQVDIGTFTEPFVEAFREDRDWLGIRPAHAEPRATEFIPAMIRLVSRLLELGVAYRGEDGSVYFSIARFPAYGRLARLDPTQLRTGGSARVLADDYGKESVRDFVLWKAVRPEDDAVQAAWDAPFGRGRPGWHLECSAMALDLVSAGYGVEEIDIHTGGVDLIFPHHEDEIAQSCAYTGHDTFARHWVHGEFLNVRGEKMSKRFGNTTTVRDLRDDGWDPFSIRLLVAQVHYRQKLDLTHEALTAARAGSHRIREFGLRLSQADRGEKTPDFADLFRRFRVQMTTALDDDLDQPRAIAALFDLIRDANRLLDGGATADPDSLSTWGWAMAVFGFEAMPAQSRMIARSTGEEREYGEIPPADSAERVAWAEYWAGRRRAAKGARDFATADRIRDLLRREGFDVRDRKDGAIELVQRS